MMDYLVDANAITFVAFSTSLIFGVLPALAGIVALAVLAVAAVNEYIEGGMSR